MPYPDPNYALLPDLLQSGGLTHFRPWVKILSKSRVPVRSCLERLNGKDMLPNATGLMGASTLLHPPVGEEME